MTEKLTDLKLQTLAAGAIRREIPDGKIGGLYIVVQPSGAKSWALRYRAAGKPTKYTIGSYPEVTIADARKAAQKALGRIANGGDPASDKKATKAVERQAKHAQSDLVEKVIEQFIERYAKPKTRDWRETQRMLTNKVVKAWRGRRLSQIGRADVHDLLDGIIDAGAPIAANRTFAAFRKMCGWAVERGIINQNPCHGLTAPSEERPRDRVLSDVEVGVVWKAFEHVGWPFGAMGKLLLLTGARRNEVAEMRWSEVDIASRRWSIPGTRTKNKRPHQLWLSDEALNILTNAPRVGNGRGEFVFSTTGKTAISGFSRAKRSIDAATLVEIGEPMREPWTFHDLRRTVATNLQKLGVRLEVTESVLNHVSGSRSGIVGVYQRHEYTSEKRAALEAWARALDAIVSGAQPENVVELAAMRG